MAVVVPSAGPIRAESREHPEREAIDLEDAECIEVQYFIPIERRSGAGMLAFSMGTNSHTGSWTNHAAHVLR